MGGITRFCLLKVTLTEIKSLNSLLDLICYDIDMYIVF